MRRVHKPDLTTLIKISWSLMWRSFLWQWLAVFGIMFICAILFLPVVLLNPEGPVHPVLGIFLVLFVILFFFLMLASFAWAFAMAFKQVLRKKFNHPQLGLIRQLEDPAREELTATDLEPEPAKMVLFKVWWALAWRSFLCWIAAEFLLYHIVRMFLILTTRFYGDAGINREEFYMFETIMGILLSLLIYALVLKYVLGKDFNGLKLETIDDVPDNNYVVPADTVVEIED